jgi:hypothetical protein
MVSSELLNILQGLSRAEKLYILQVLISGLAQQEADLIKPEQSYPVWSPYTALSSNVKYNNGRINKLLL